MEGKGKKVRCRRDLKQAQEDFGRECVDKTFRKYGKSKEVQEEKRV